jgi:hypothetical protein
MKRVTAGKQRKKLYSLNVLAAILNFDWEGGDVKQLEELIMAIHPTASALFLKMIELAGDGLKDKRKAKSVQEELKADLLPILAPEGEVDPKAAYFRIRKVLGKLNEIPVRTEWDIEPIEYRWEPVVTSEAGAPPLDLKLFRLPPDEVESNLPDFNPTAELKLLGYRWHIGRRFEPHGGYNLSRVLYELLVLDAFESGTIERLRTCPECKAFFVAEDTRQHFCSDEHRNEFNNKQRLTSGYFKERRGGKRKRDLARARKLLREGKSPGEIARATGLSLRVLSREGIVR